MIKTLPLLIGMLVSLFTTAKAQWNIFLDTKLSHDSNLLRIYRAIPDKVIMPQAGISYIGRNFELFYAADWLRLSSQSQYNYHTHTAGIDFFVENNPLVKYTWGLNLTGRFDQPEYANYDYLQLSGYFNLHLDVTGWTMIKTGAELFRKIFMEEKAWNHWETRVFYLQNFYLPTRSTIRLEMSHLHRDFTPVTLSAGDYDWSTGTYLDSVTSYRSELPTLNQIVGTARWAQSFSNQLGGYTELSYRFNTTKGNPYQLDQVAFSPIDDYFGYRGASWLSSLKWKINDQLWIRANYTHYKFEYINRPVYAYDFVHQQWLTDTAGYFIEIAPVRQDEGQIFDLQIGYSVANFLRRASDLTLMLMFSYYDNRSNDKYFQANSYSLGLKLSYDLQW